MKRSILIVDDNVRTYRSLQINFQPLGYIAAYAPDSKSALELIEKQQFDLIIQDLMLGTEDSRNLLDIFISRRNPPPVIMITGYASIDSAVDSIKRGAFDYVQKPIDFDELLEVVEKALSSVDSRYSNHTRAVKKQGFFKTESPVMSEVMEKAAKLASTDLPILILGENGTGKELLAEFIHQNSLRKDKELHKINCAAFQESILDNELFGHNKGAYTGAEEEYKGIFELANGHTLFLDEIGDMSLSIQSKILRTLQNNEIRRIGGNKVITVDVRFIAATNKNIKHMIGEKEFREDLYYRLSTVVLNLPPLRDRLCDIPGLVNVFVAGGADLANSCKKFSEEVLDIFMHYTWPGNIRELKNAVQYSLAISSSDCIYPEDLPVNIRKNIQESGIHSFSTVEQAEKEIIMTVLFRHGFNKSRAAAELNMTRKTLYKKIEKYGIREAENGTA
ncbi:MAG: sigma-54 dependent transcriptional regulator [Spirochaetia bacterium]|nr:sigma-54 dependent transcriptional regulator [Spirochaetia bacterium]